MKIIIWLLIAFAALVFIYNFIKLRKRRKNNKNTVSEYNRKYLHKNIKNNKNSNSSNYNNYITKYNSQLDYLEKKDLSK
ncbi:MAG: hypothetical protein J6C64_10950 [Lachnospiraceae bacterium]|nr:hypothetical protein [Lachnospiraceae bacterium]